MNCEGLSSPAYINHNPLAGKTLHITGRGRTRLWLVPPAPVPTILTSEDQQGLRAVRENSQQLL